MLQPRLGPDEVQFGLVASTASQRHIELSEQCIYSTLVLIGNGSMFLFHVYTFPLFSFMNPALELDGSMALDQKMQKFDRTNYDTFSWTLQVRFQQQCLEIVFFGCQFSLYSSFSFSQNSMLLSQPHLE